MNLVEVNKHEGHWEGISPIWNNIHEPGGHYNKWNRPVTGQTLHDSTHEVSKVVKLTEAKSGMTVSKAGERAKWGVAVQQG